MWKRAVHASLRSSFFLEVKRMLQPLLLLLLLLLVVAVENVM
jgi:hypothetical protein